MSDLANLVVAVGDALSQKIVLDLKGENEKLKKELKMELIRLMFRTRPGEEARIPHPWQNRTYESSDAGDVVGRGIVDEENWATVPGLQYGGKAVQIQRVELFGCLEWLHFLIEDGEGVPDWDRMLHADDFPRDVFLGLALPPADGGMSWKESYLLGCVAGCSIYGDYVCVNIGDLLQGEPSCVVERTPVLQGEPDELQSFMDQHPEHDPLFFCGWGPALHAEAFVVLGGRGSAWLWLTRFVGESQAE